jgi:hypothetical protein
MNCAWAGKGWDGLHDSRTAAGVEKGRVIMALQAALSRNYKLGRKAIKKRRELGKVRALRGYFFFFFGEARFWAYGRYRLWLNAIGWG